MVGSQISFMLNIFQDVEVGCLCPCVLSRYPKGISISSIKVRKIKFYCYVNKNSITLALLLLIINDPRFLIISFLEKIFKGLYTNFKVKP